MRDLERELSTLTVEWPQTPDLAGAVRRRIESVPQRGARRRRWVALAAALVVVTVGAVEPARSAVLEFLGFKSVKVERREPTAPVRPAGSGLQLGRAVTQAAAERLAGFDPRPPAALGAPAAVFFSEGPPAGGNVSYTYAPGPGVPESSQTGVGLLVTEYAASVTPFLEKSVGMGARLERFRIDGDPAYFISGAPHGVMLEDRDRQGYYDEQRLAGNTLLLERRGLLIRIEGRIGRERATAIARSIPT